MTYTTVYMGIISEKIYDALSNQKNVFLVGPTDSGKTRYVENELIPFLEGKKLQAVYFKDSDHVSDVAKEIIIIVDEVETLLDKSFLENQHKEELPYYSPEYLEKVRKWHDKLRDLSAPGVFIITRNDKVAIDYLVNNVKTTDWRTPVECIFFERSPD